MEMKKKIISNRKNKGFTLIELMVATSIFMIIMLIAMGALVVASDSAKKSQALRSAMDNVNFAMETMTRSLRTGTNYSCVFANENIDLSVTPTPHDCPVSDPAHPGSMIAFLPSQDPLQPQGPVAYQRVARDDGATRSYALQRCNSSGECVDIISPSVNVQDLRFYVNGSDLADTIQPSVYIIIRGVVTVKGVPTSFAVQTMASQRSFE